MLSNSRHDQESRAFAGIGARQHPRELKEFCQMVSNAVAAAVDTYPEVGLRSLDRELALSRLGGDMELLEEIALLFLSDSERMMQELNKAASALDGPALDRAAHTIKGCVSNFGAQRLYDAALKLERMGRSGDLSGLPSAHRTLEWAMAELETDLRELVAAR